MQGGKAHRLGTVLVLRTAPMMLHKEEELEFNTTTLWAGEFMGIGPLQGIAHMMLTREQEEIHPVISMQWCDGYTDKEFPPCSTLDKRTMEA